MHALMSRWNQVESQVTQISTDQMHLRVNLESRMEGLRALAEDDLRKELDRQKSLWLSFMGEQRIRSTQLEVEVEEIRKQGSGL